jgi:predicted ribosomally synthesized peptide with SipW-like signal peptide
MAITPVRFLVILAIAIACGFGIGGGLASWTDSPDESRPTGLTVGGMIPGQPDPDLVSIDLADGRSGFLRSDDMARSNSDRAFIRSTGENSEETVLPVYARDGNTVIGEFVAGTARWE